MNRFLVALCAVFWLSTPTTQASPYYPGSGPARTQPQPFPPARTQAPGVREAAVMLKDGIERLTGFIKEMRSQGRHLNPASAMAFLDQEIAPHFDFAYMTRWAAGPMYRQLNDRQRLRLERKLERMFLTTLAKHLTSYTDQQIRYFPPRPSADGKELNINVWVTQPQGYPTKLTFRLYQSKHGWKVFDVVANNTSAVVHYRRFFKQMLRRSGPAWSG